MDQNQYDPEHYLSDLIRMKMSLEVVRRQVNCALDGMTAQIDALMPEVEPKKARSARDWKKELKSWRTAK